MKQFAWAMFLIWSVGVPLTAAAVWLAGMARTDSGLIVLTLMALVALAAGFGVTCSISKLSEED